MSDIARETPPADWDANKFAVEHGAGALAQPAEFDAQARAALVGDPPVMPLPSDGEVTLSRGLSHEDEWQTTAFMREVTGADEEALSRFDLNKPGTDFLYWDTLLARTTVRIGNVDIEGLPIGQRQTKLRQLLMGDREAMYLGLVRATWGEVRTIESVTCPMCGHTTDYGLALTETTEHPSDFPAKTLEDPTQMYYEVKLRKGDTVEVRLPTGEDMSALSVLWKTDPSPAERNTQMLGRLIYTHNGTPVRDPVRFTQSLGSPDRSTLLTFVVEEQPGPRLGGVPTSCASCEQEFFLQLGLARLLQLAT